MSHTSLGLFERAVDIKIHRSTPIARGRSGTAKYRLTTDEGQDLFVKIATTSSPPRARALVRREAKVLAQLPAGQDPTLVAHVDSEELTALATSWVDGRTSVRWTAEDAVTAVASLSDLHEVLRGIQFDARVLVAEGARFHTFARSDISLTSKSLSAADADWIRANRCTLIGLERIGRREMGELNLMHCDLAIDNMLFSRLKRVVFVDWAHAGLGNQKYDLAGLLIRVRAEHAWSPDLDLVLHSSELIGSSDEWTAALVLATGMFLEPSKGQAEAYSSSLLKQRARYARAGIGLLKEAIG